VNEHIKETMDGFNANPPPPITASWNDTPVDIAAVLREANERALANTGYPITGIHFGIPAEHLADGPSGANYASAGAAKQ